MQHQYKAMYSTPRYYLTKKLFSQAKF